MMLKYNLKMVMEVDLPPLPQTLIDGILAWHDSKKALLDNIGAAGVGYPWIASHIRDNVSIDDPVNLENTIPGSPWNSEFVKLFPEAIPFFDSLPLTNIERIVLIESTKLVPPHVDRSKTHCPNNSLEPASYRMHLRKAVKSNGFYMQPRPMKEWGNHRAIIMGSPGYEHMTESLPARSWKIDPGKWWLLDNFCTQHGSDWKEGDDKVIVSVQGQIDPVRHKELLDRSAHMKCIKHEALVTAENGSPEQLAAFIKIVNAIPDDTYESSFKPTYGSLFQ